MRIGLAVIGVICLAPGLAGCKMAVAKGAARLALGAERAEALDPLTPVRRKLLEPFRQGSGAPQPPDTRATPQGRPANDPP